MISVEVEVQKHNEVSIKNLTELRAFSLPIYCYSTPPTLSARDNHAAILGGKTRVARAWESRYFLLMAVERKYSDYYKQLDDEVKKRYKW